MREYTREDFNTEAPYRELLAIESPFERDIELEKMAVLARSVGVTNFKKLFKSFQDALKQRDNIYVEDSTTTFTGQKLELACGKWRCDDFGVSRDGLYSTEIACPHPIMPVERLVNIDTCEEKLRIAYSKGRKWQELVVPRSILASAKEIVKPLAARGVGVTSENARLLVQYLSDVENLNYDLVPEKNSIGRLGHIGEGEFSPYMDGLAFDGEDGCFATMFDAVKSKRGSYEEWIDIAKRCRGMSLTARIILAASFASPLIEPLGGLPFFVHLWAGKSATGKTVALQLAASVWGDPAIGRYVQTFDGTEVGFEMVASFLNSLPYCLDELQLARESRNGHKEFNVYKLAQGAGRTRGSKTGGIQRTTTWRNCMLTTGETPLVSESDGAGAINRVIEIECCPERPVIINAKDMSWEIQRCFGHAGEVYIKRLYSDMSIFGYLKKRYDALFDELAASDTTEKQAMAAAMIVVADELITEWFFHDKAITVADIATTLKSRETVDVGKRGYNYMCDWVAQNSLKMRQGIESGDIYGLIDGDIAYIIRSVFDQAAAKGGFNPSVLLSYFKSNNLIDARIKGNTRPKRIGGGVVNCVCLRLPVISDEATDEVTI